MIEGISFFLFLILFMQHQVVLKKTVKVIAFLFKKEKLFGLLLFISKSTTRVFGFIFKIFLKKTETTPPKPTWYKIKF